MFQSVLHPSPPTPQLSITSSSYFGLGEVSRRSPVLFEKRHTVFQVALYQAVSMIRLPVPYLRNDISFYLLPKCLRHQVCFQLRYSVHLCRLCVFGYPINTLGFRSLSNTILLIIWFYHGLVRVPHCESELSSQWQMISYRVCVGRPRWVRRAHSCLLGYPGTKWDVNTLTKWEEEIKLP